MADIKQWIAAVEDRIAGVVTGEGLNARRMEVVQGPQVVTFRVRLLSPGTQQLRKMLALGPAIAQAVQVDNVRITDTGRGILIELPSPEQRTPCADQLARATSGLEVAVGLDQWRQPVTVDLDDFPNVVFVGPVGRGKSQAMRAVLFALASRNRASKFNYVIFSQKRADWTAFVPAMGCMGLVSEPDEVVRAVQWAADTLQERAHDGINTPAIMLVVDDFPALLQRAPAIVGPLTEVASMGRAARIFLMVGSQQAGSKNGMGATLIDDNAACRIVYKTASAGAAARATGAGGTGADQLTNRKGDALFMADRTERIATGYAPDSLVGTLQRAPWGRKPWDALRDATSAQNGLGGVQNGLERAQNGAERPRTGLELVRTGQNGLERAERAVLGAVDAANGANSGGASSEPFLELVAAWRGGTAKLDGKRAPTATEAQALRALFAELGSKEKVYTAAWGYKNGYIAKYLGAVLDQTGD
jgi:hypothetical protein